VLRLLDLLFSLEILSKFHHVPLLCHDFVSAGATSHGGLIVFQHVDADEVLSTRASGGFIDRFR
jgi:hypothetical protein